ncbi:MAG: hypothetical protein L7S63_07495 [Flavobacteriales bacterium]|nr:hypothetical protein [Flavobacteriales bacterium]
MTTGHPRSSALWLSALLLLTTQVVTGQAVPRPGLMDLPLSARFAGSAESMGAPLSATLGDALGQASLLDSTHAGQLHFAYVDYFAGTAMASALYVRRPETRKWVWHTGLRNLGYGSFTGRDPVGVETGSFTAADVAWVSGISTPLDSNLTVAATVWLGQSSLAERRSAFGQMDISANYFRRDRKLRVAAHWRPWGGMRTLNSAGTDGRFDPDLRLSVTKGFDNAPFLLYSTYDEMQEWDLAPEGYYDDTVDPLTGDTVANGTWAFGDRLLRHLAIGAGLNLGENLGFRFGYHHRRRQELRLTNAPGTAGFAWGIDFKVRRFQLAFARNTYHTAGASTHLSIRTRLTDR